MEKIVEKDIWKIGEVELSNRLFLGTASYPSPQSLLDAINISGAEVITVALRRMNPSEGGGEDFWGLLKGLDVNLLPNTAGCFSAKEAITTAQMARELFDTHWIKLEVIGDEYNLQPNPFELVEATKELIAQGFEVFPYCTDDLVVCEKLAELGCKVIMPWGAPIGSGKGLINPYALKNLRERLKDRYLVVDAGIGAPSHACQAMELGYDAVLLNTAVSHAQSPVTMASAFKHAIRAGREGYLAGIMPERDFAKPSTPFLGKPFDIQL